MANQGLTFQDALEVAINEEIKAYNLYKNLSERITNSGSKTMLVELATQEKGHQLLLEKALKTKNTMVLGKKLPTENRGIADFLVETEIDADAAPQDVMIFAMKAELKAFNFYNELKGYFAGSEMETLFGSLAAEEQRHKIKLEEEYEEYFLKEN
jgi:rubrerythrin